MNIKIQNHKKLILITLCVLIMIFLVTYIGSYILFRNNKKLQVCRTEKATDNIDMLFIKDPTNPNIKVSRAISYFYLPIAYWEITLIMGKKYKNLKLEN